MARRPPVLPMGLMALCLILVVACDAEDQDTQGQDSEGDSVESSVDFVVPSGERPRLEVPECDELLTKLEPRGNADELARQLIGRWQHESNLWDETWSYRKNGDVIEYRDGKEHARNEWYTLDGSYLVHRTSHAGDPNETELSYELATHVVDGELSLGRSCEQWVFFRKSGRSGLDGRWVSIFADIDRVENSEKPAYYSTTGSTARIELDVEGDRVNIDSRLCVGWARSGREPSFDLDEGGGQWSGTIERSDDAFIIKLEDDEHGRETVGRVVNDKVLVIERELLYNGAPSRGCTRLGEGIELGSAVAAYSDHRDHRYDQ